jgi:hypothetical protein
VPLPLLPLLFFLPVRYLQHHRQTLPRILSLPRAPHLLLLLLKLRSASDAGSAAAVLLQAQDN